MIDYQKHLQTSPKTRNGQVCIRDTEITVIDVLGHLASGKSIQEVLTDFPDLTQEDLQVVFTYSIEVHLRRAKPIPIYMPAVKRYI